MPELMVLNGVCAGTVFVLPEIPTVLGRSPESHLQVSDPWISSMHAMFERRGSEVWVVDLDSRNGTFHGEERVSECRLEDGALLRFGRTEVRFALGSTWAETTPTPREDRGRPEGQRDTVRADAALRTPAAREPEVDPYALALRPVVVLRMSLDARGVEREPDAAERLHVAVEAMAGAALEEGAAVGRLASTGVLALFGLAGPRADDPARAVRAARAARLAIRRMGGMDLRAAVDAGPLLAGAVGAAAVAEIAALGPAADRCERLAALARPGDLVVGPGAADARVEGALRDELDGAEVAILRGE